MRDENRRDREQRHRVEHEEAEQEDPHLRLECAPLELEPPELHQPVEHEADPDQVLQLEAQRAPVTADPVYGGAEAREDMGDAKANDDRDQHHRVFE